MRSWFKVATVWKWEVRCVGQESIFRTWPLSAPREDGGGRSQRLF